MAQKIRYFLCKKCQGKTAFDMSKISLPESNFLVCSKCKRKWYATIQPGCCSVNIKFAHSNNIVGETSYCLQSFKK